VVALHAGLRFGYSEWVLFRCVRGFASEPGGCGVVHDAAWQRLLI
jgi:hypothetical protein